MPTKEELQALYKTLPNENLLAILSDRSSYTDIALEAASAEILDRNIPESEVHDYEEARAAAAGMPGYRNITDALSWWQKMLFYLFWLPLLNFAFKMNYRDDRHLLKLRQANYYSLCGFLGMVLATLVSVWLSLTDYEAAFLWLAAFFPAYLQDDRFNRYLLERKFKNDTD